MNIVEFAEKSKETMLYPTNKEKISCLTLGIIEEWGEVQHEINNLYDVLYGLHADETKVLEAEQKLLGELGDFCFYVYGLSFHYRYKPVAVQGEHIMFDVDIPELSQIIKKTIRDNAWELVNEDYKIRFQHTMNVFHSGILEICDDWGFNLSDVLSYNVEKLQGRKNRGTLRGDGER